MKHHNIPQLDPLNILPDIRSSAYPSSFIGHLSAFRSGDHYRVIPKTLQGEETIDLCYGCKRIVCLMPALIELAEAIAEEDAESTQPNPMWD